MLAEPVTFFLGLTLPLKLGAALTPTLGLPGAQILPGEQTGWKQLLTSVVFHTLLISLQLFIEILHVFKIKKRRWLGFYP